MLGIIPPRNINPIDALAALDVSRVERVPGSAVFAAANLNDVIDIVCGASIGPDLDAKRAGRPLGNLRRLRDRPPVREIRRASSDNGNANGILVDANVVARRVVNNRELDFAGGFLREHIDRKLGLVPLSLKPKRRRVARNRRRQPELSFRSGRRGNVAVQHRENRPRNRRAIG